MWRFKMGITTFGSSRDIQIVYKYAKLCNFFNSQKIQIDIIIRNMFLINHIRDDGKNIIFSFAKEMGKWEYPYIKLS